MKKIVLIVSVVAMFMVNQAAAQIEINAYGGYVPGANTMYSYNGYRLRIDGGGNFGVGLGYITPYGDTEIELSYMRFSSTIRQQGGTIDLVDPQPINVEYYQIGGLKPLMMTAETLVPYGLFTLGAARFNPTQEPEDYWRFAVNLGLGLKYYVSDKVGIRIQARLLMPLYFSGAGMGCGIGTGGASCGGGVGFGSEILQADFTGGVVLRIDK